ncbi:hypothetical protein [Panacagrimonas perspica]|uniref:hypothetical protein n=1 Tax=Panacagrimonas perspica TaxID=381431 RepID=UPI001447FE1E|nr:hypothetical protein [Panacagrimonas perspica]
MTPRVVPRAVAAFFFFAPRERRKDIINGSRGAMMRAHRIRIRRSPCSKLDAAANAYDVARKEVLHRLEWACGVPLSFLATDFADERG